MNQNSPGYTIAEKIGFVIGRGLRYVIIGGVIFIIGGLMVKHQGQSPIDMASVKRDNAKLVSDKNGRQIEYFVYGNKNPEAPVIINMHGSGLDGTFEKAVHQSACQELGVRGIAISLQDTVIEQYSGVKHVLWR